MTRDKGDYQGPKRIQRKRTKGWRMPEGAVYVGRPTKWGNPYEAGDLVTAQEAVNGYRHHVQTHLLDVAARQELRGKNLACWCPLDRPCHADLLLELANA